MKNIEFKLVELFEAISQMSENERNEDQNNFLDLIESKGLDLEEGDLDDKVSRIRLEPKDWEDIRITMLRLDDDWKKDM